MGVPDRLSLEPVVDDGSWSFPLVYSDKKGTYKYEYLASTPAREHADELVEALGVVAQSLAWVSFGEFRGFDAGLATPDEAIGVACAILSKINRTQETE